METVSFEPRLTGSGWAKARLQVGPTSIEISASYISDAIGDLVRAAAALPSGAEQVRVTWIEEPGEFRWILDAQGRTLTVTVLWFDDWNEEEHLGRQLLRASCSIESFCEAVGRGAKLILDQHGAANYRARWGHDFPEVSFATLLAALEAH